MHRNHKRSHSLIHKRWKTLSSLPSLKFLYLRYISTFKDELLNNYAGWMNRTRLFISLIPSITGAWLPMYNRAAGLCAVKRAYYNPNYCCWGSSGQWHTTCRVTWIEFLTRVRNFYFVRTSQKSPVAHVHLRSSSCHETSSSLTPTSAKVQNY
jgi:hypothetical protein